MRLPPVVAGLLTLPLMACTPDAAPDAEAPATPLESAVQPSPAMRAPVGAAARASLVDGTGAAAGTATFRQGATGVLIRVEATGLTPGWHGLHLHGVGQCEGPKFTSAGAHVKPGGSTAVHGLLNADGPESGDLPNLYAGADGRGFAEVFTADAALVDGAGGPNLLDADGAAILIHAAADDHAAQPIGGSGDRVACGVIAAG